MTGSSLIVLKKLMADREESEFLSNKMDSRNTKEAILLRLVVAVSRPLPVLVLVLVLVLGRMLRLIHLLVPRLPLSVFADQFEALLALSAGLCFAVQVQVGRLPRIHLISCHHHLPV
jgi:hypothetical protein